MELKEAVPQHIKELFRVTKKLFEFYFYEYEFVTVGSRQATFMLEMALNLKYYELNCQECKKELYKLIDWFLQSNYLKDKTLDALRILRNSFAHPKQHVVHIPAQVKNTLEIII